MALQSPSQIVMARKKSIRASLPYVVVSFFFFASLYHHAVSTFSSAAANLRPHHHATTAVLLHDWEVLVILSPETPPPLNHRRYSCIFHTSELTPANFSGVLPFPDRATFACLLPPRAHRRLPYRQPLLILKPQTPPAAVAPPLMPLWSYLVYDSLSTEHDVVLFVKGINTRQGYNRHPKEFRCLFSNDDDVANGVRTAVTHSKQEVFRCKRPPLTAVDGATELVKVSLEIVAEKTIVPSVAYYTPPRKLATSATKSLLCAATMVYDVTKFLREWVLYHSKIGVDKFLLYDNGSDDDLGSVVAELVLGGYDVTTYTWRWPKTQEAGFSHSAVYASDACTWMLYLDVDEFVYSPPWQNLTQPSKSLLQRRITTNSSTSLAQITINCREFGPSDQRVHPATGVINGYDCRRRLENRHKSVVRLDAVDASLANVIHHFVLGEGYMTKKVDTTVMVVNHYKYQAWPEFKTKFRRRVSTYVLDWTQKMNPKSNDRTPGLGFAPIEPQGWAHKFCEVRDEKLKDLAIRWFGIESN